MKLFSVVAVLETMWDWRNHTSSAGYKESAPPYFRINRDNHSGRRLYSLLDPAASLLVTNACRELVSAADKHGTPNPEWLKDNLRFLCHEGADLVLICGRVAQATYTRCGFKCPCTVLNLPHPAARGIWNSAYIKQVKEQIAMVQNPQQEK